MMMIFEKLFSVGNQAVKIILLVVPLITKKYKPCGKIIKFHVILGTATSSALFIITG